MSRRLSLFLLPLLLAVVPAAAEVGGLDHAAGKAVFEKLWVAAPASTLGSDGLGPLYNARACTSCHRDGGGGAAPGDGPLPAGMAVGLGKPAAPDPLYGRQIQTRGPAGIRAEADPHLDWSEHQVTLAGGEVVSLRAPRLRLDLSLGPLAVGTAVSLRIAPALTGLGLVARLSQAEILAAEDPQDRDGDGVSGRTGPGRFGWKAEGATLREQVAAAFHLDLGLSTSLFPEPSGDCTPAQTACRAAPDGRGASGVEVDDPILDLVAGYTAGLPPRIPREDAAGKEVFLRLGCALCHRADLGGPGARPWSDFLLHDMGEGLADAAPGSGGREWRTAPLWRSLGGSDPAAPALLHDGRARSLPEAILWHGGEAQAMRDSFITLPPGDRAALIRFLEGL